jgi:hypothetical protein
MSNKQYKKFRKIAREKVDDFNIEQFIAFVMTWGFWRRLRFCVGIMFKVREK